jgi:hypothetical protein
METRCFTYTHNLVDQHILEIFDARVRAQEGQTEGAYATSVSDPIETEGTRPINAYLIYPFHDPLKLLFIDDSPELCAVAIIVRVG